jgi:hypothetical protein
VIPLHVGEERWLHIQKHAALRDRAPKAVVVSIGAVIGDAQIAESLPSWTTTEKTTSWSCWVATQRALGYVSIEYEKYPYDQHEEETSFLLIFPEFLSRDGCTRFGSPGIFGVPTRCAPC